MPGETYKGLTLRIWLPDKQFGVADTITAYCILENTGPEIIKVLYWMILGPHLRLWLTTPDGLEITLHLVWKTLVYTIADDFATVLPGRLIGRTVEVPVWVVRDVWLGKEGEQDPRAWDISLGARVKRDIVPVWKLGLAYPSSGTYQLHAEFYLRGSNYSGRGKGTKAWTGVLRSQKVPIHLDFGEASDHGNQQPQ